MTEFVVLIPARLDSSRLPGKALADIHGKPMVVRVAEQAAKAKPRASSLPPTIPTFRRPVRRTASKSS